MCLPDFFEFKVIRKDNPLIGYRNWRMKNGILRSECMNYEWNKVVEGPHKVAEADSGIYAYNNNNYNYYNYYYYNYNYNNNYYNYNYYNYYYYYYIAGIIHQYGRTAIHKIGQRSTYARIKTLFTIRKSDAIGPEKFLNWIEKFNNEIIELAKKFEAETMHWQDFIENNRRK
jgi:hypothetical protein